MKAKITRKDGTVIELEGTADELAVFIHEPRIEIKAEPAPAVETSGLIKLIEEMQKQDKQAPKWPERVPHCPGIVPRPHWPGTLFPLDTIDPCSIGIHDFPGVWLGVNPPACTRCGVQAAPYQLICTNEGLAMHRTTIVPSTTT